MVPNSISGTGRAMIAPAVIRLRVLPNFHPPPLNRSLPPPLSSFQLHFCYFLPTLFERLSFPPSPLKKISLLGCIGKVLVTLLWIPQSCLSRRNFDTCYRLFYPTHIFSLLRPSISYSFLLDSQTFATGCPLSLFLFHVYFPPPIDFPFSEVVDLLVFRFQLFPGTLV